MATSLTEPALAESVILQPFESRVAMRVIDELLQDTHFAIRMLRKSPVFTVVIVAMLAIGMGVNTAVFGVVNAILFRPLPVKDPGSKSSRPIAQKLRRSAPFRFPICRTTGPRPATCSTASRAIVCSGSCSAAVPSRLPAVSP